jgi:hypothetical protein
MFLATVMTPRVVMMRRLAMVMGGGFVMRGRRVVGFARGVLGCSHACLLH